MRTLISTVSLLLVAAPVAATNGMFLVGYGAESTGRGGANLAISDRSLAINFNPAGITQLQGRHYSLDLSILRPELELENGLNARTDGEGALFPLPAFTYVSSRPDSRLAFGLGFIAQGGMGAEFRNLATPFGTRDDIFSEVRFATLAPTVAWAIDDDMSIGATLNIGWGDVAFSFFPDSSFFFAPAPEMSFFGLDMEPAGGLQANLRLGWWWRPTPRWTVGAIYQTETESNFEGGDLTVNFEEHPFLGRRVGYDASVEGFTFAAQAGIGAAWRASDDVMVAFDIKRYFWDDAIDTIVVMADDPDVAGAPPTIEVPFVFEWEDQWVLALGVEWRANDVWTWRAGWNWGENPVPDDTLNPLFPATVEHHLSIGCGWLTGNRVVNVALERAFDATRTNNNPNPQINPFGPGTTVSHDQWTVSVGVAWTLDSK